MEQTQQVRLRKPSDMRLPPSHVVAKLGSDPTNLETIDQIRSESSEVCASRASGWLIHATKPERMQDRMGNLELSIDRCHNGRVVLNFAIPPDPEGNAPCC
jgi:hypothetical protein